VQHRLPDDHCSRPAECANDFGIALGPIGAEQGRRSAGGRQSGHVEDVFDRDRNAVQRTAINPVGKVAVGGRCRGAGIFLIDDHECASRRIHLPTSLERIVCHLRRRCVVRPNRGSHLPCCSVGWSVVHNTPFMMSAMGTMTTRGCSG
jgi:hypothetical protein